eukprot:CAMPEP_0198122546 /NCGR_PEP_ID=MMETSP1442-20131203/35123_1 /TAXON_ID= /ORGANISM="Craspedostauros australis, Strain CCMP3328" /LENGTH=91 /DNA_ID=CAMNT_0043781591 /DNA_START=32 /DNA_END=304 /DNA_ORIENTATION=-
MAASRTGRQTGSKMGHRRPHDRLRALRQPQDEASGGGPVKRSPGPSSMRGWDASVASGLRVLFLLEFLCSCSCCSDSFATVLVLPVREFVS